LSPRDAHSIGSFARSVAEFGAARYESAADWARKVTEGTPDMPSGWRYLAASLGQIDRLDEARSAVDQLLKMNAHDSIANTRAIHGRLPLASAEFSDRVVDGLRKALARNCRQRHP
jgi:Flp pilus assembly protein TadD